jgi:hypothetical protein
MVGFWKGNFMIRCRIESSVMNEIVSLDSLLSHHLRVQWVVVILDCQIWLISIHPWPIRLHILKWTGYRGNKTRYLDVYFRGSVSLNTISFSIGPLSLFLLKTSELSGVQVGLSRVELQVVYFSLMREFDIRVKMHRDNRLLLFHIWNSSKMVRVVVVHVYFRLG